MYWMGEKKNAASVTENLNATTCSTYRPYIFVWCWPSPPPPLLLLRLERIGIFAKFHVAFLVARASVLGIALPPQSAWVRRHLWKYLSPSLWCGSIFLASRSSNQIIDELDNMKIDWYFMLLSVILVLLAFSPLPHDPSMFEDEWMKGWCLFFKKKNDKIRNENRILGNYSGLGCTPWNRLENSFHQSHQSHQNNVWLAGAFVSYSKTSRFG